MHPRCCPPGLAFSATHLVNGVLASFHQRFHSSTTRGSVHTDIQDTRTTIFINNALSQSICVLVFVVRGYCAFTCFTLTVSPSLSVINTSSIWVSASLLGYRDRSPRWYKQGVTYPRKIYTTPTIEVSAQMEFLAADIGVFTTVPREAISPSAPPTPLVPL